MIKQQVILLIMSIKLQSFVGLVITVDNWDITFVSQIQLVIANICCYSFISSLLWCSNLILPFEPYRKEEQHWDLVLEACEISIRTASIFWWNKKRNTASVWPLKKENYVLPHWVFFMTNNAWNSVSPRCCKRGNVYGTSFGDKKSTVSDLLWCLDKDMDMDMDTMIED